ncbi:hypothetical protein GOODEAATRI_007253, partial [Goodea atripinnis]
AHTAEAQHPTIQYSFIYQALLEYYLYGDTELDVCSLESHLQRLHNTRAPHDRLGLEEEFRKLTNVRIMKENMRTGNLPANMRKNRVLQIIPCKNGFYAPNRLQAEGLFYRNPGPPVSHCGGLLEDGVGVEVSLNRYAHRTQRKGAGTVC